MSWLILVTGLQAAPQGAAFFRFDGEITRILVKVPIENKLLV
jgi:hypothetical protein